MKGRRGVLLGVVGLVCLAGVLAVVGAARRGPTLLPEAVDVDLSSVVRLSAKDCVTVTGARLDILSATTKEQASEALVSLDVFALPDEVRRAAEFDATNAGVAANSETRDERRKATAIWQRWLAVSCPSAASSAGSSPSTGSSQG